MGVHAIRRWIDDFLNRGARTGRVRPTGPRPRLESLEDRTLPTAGPLDPTFGSGGTVQTNLPWDSDIYLMRSVQLADGKIVAAGTVAGLYGRDFALERFNADGSLDTSFGAGGQVHTPLLNSRDFDVGLALQSDGKIVVAGSSLGDFITIRYNADGSVDGGFGTGGYVLTAFTGTADAHAVAIQSDGKIIVAGDDQGASALVRYNADGSPDAGFGSGGAVITAMLGQDEDVALQSDGKIVAAGETGSFGHPVAGLIRYNTDGSIDAGFGNGGLVVTTLALPPHNIIDPLINPPAGRLVSEALAPDGKIVATDRYTGGVARYNADGSIDASFGNGGVVTVADNASGRAGEVQAVAIEADGRVMVGGRFESGLSGTWFVARYNVDGSPDGTFGSGGQVTTTFFQGESDAEATDLVLNPDGGVTAVGVGRQFASFIIPAEPTSTAAALARYDANGAPAAGFGTNGQELVNFEGPSIDYAAGVVVQPDDKVVVAIHLETTGGGIDGKNDLALARYNADGSLDTTFGSGGAARLPAGWVYSLALQSDGKILVLVSSSGSNDLLRFNADGSLDTSFGSNGAVALDFIGRAVTVDANGDILVTGGTIQSDVSDPPSNVARFLPNGSPDTTFGGTGEVKTAINQANYQAYAIVVQSDGKIVIAGFVQSTTSPNAEHRIGLIRYNTDGSLDASFGSDGVVTTLVGAGSGAASLALEPDGRIVVGGGAQIGTGPYFLLVRYNTDGSLDTTFAQGGIAFNTDLSTVEGVAVQPDGTIVAITTAWYGAPGLTVVSYAPDGRRDITFDALGSGATASGVAVGPDGKVVVTGWFGVSGSSNTVVARFLDQPPPPPPVFVVGTDGSLMGENYISPGWATLSPAGTILSVSAVTDAGGGTDVFAIAASDKSLWERTFNGWVEISVGAFQQISATTNAAGHAVIFGVLGGGAGAYADSLWEYHNGGWSELAGNGFAFGPSVMPSSVLSVSAVGTSKGEVAFAIANDHSLWQWTPTSPALGWTQVSTGWFQQVSAGLDANGQADAFGVLGQGAFAGYANSLWEFDHGGWTELPGPVVYLDYVGYQPSIGPSTYASVAAGLNGEEFGVASDHTLWQNNQELSTGSFAQVSASQTTSGADEVFGTLTDGSFWEYSNGGGAGPMWQELLPGGVASSSAP